MRAMGPSPGARRGWALMWICGHQRLARYEERREQRGRTNHGGEGKGNGLSGSSGGDGDEITSGESHGPRLALNGGRVGEAGLLDLGHDLRTGVG